MKTITIKNKSRCYPVNLISITKLDGTNSKVKVIWTNPYNMVGTGIVSVEISIDNGTTWYGTQSFPIGDLQGIVDSSILGAIADNQNVLWRLVIQTGSCGNIYSNIITTTWVRVPVVIFDEPAYTTNIPYSQNTFKNWPLSPSNGTPFRDLITETGTYKFEFTITKNQQSNAAVFTQFRLGFFNNLNTSSDINPNLYAVVGNIDPQVGSIFNTLILNLTAGTPLYMFFYQYNGGYMRFIATCKIKVTRL